MGLSPIESPHKTSRYLSLQSFCSICRHLLEFQCQIMAPHFDPPAPRLGFRVDLEGRKWYQLSKCRTTVLLNFYTHNRPIRLAAIQNAADRETDGQSDRNRLPMKQHRQPNKMFGSLIRRPTNWWGSAKRDIMHTTAIPLRRVRFLVKRV